MEYTAFGKTEFQISRLGLGTWQAYGWASSSEDSFLKTVSFALDSGINLIDTAPAYGKGYSERLVGKAISGKRDKVILATKFSPKESEPEKIRKSLEQSLINLKTDYIDLYQHHWPPKSPPLDETLDELFKLKAEGKIRAIGVSNYMEPEFAEVSDLSKLDSLQVCYSLLWRSVENEVLSICKKHEIAVLPYSPLCQGILAGRLKETEELPKDVRRQNKLLADDKLKETFKIVEKIKEIATRSKTSMAALSLRWLLENPLVTSPIVGASSVEQLKESLSCFDTNVDDETIASLSKLTLDFSRDLKPHDTLWGWHPRK